MSKKDSSLGLAITSVGDLLWNKTITKNQENKEINSEVEYRIIKQFYITQHKRKNIPGFPG